jgi:cytochrome P450
LTNVLKAEASIPSELTVRPAMPPTAPDSIGGLGVLAALRRNALTAFPSRCLDEPVIRMRLPGRALFLVNDGDAIAEVFVAKAADYTRMPAGRRILGPVVGRGLLTSEGDRWRQQRRAMAPAFTPRALPMMAAHIIRAAEPICQALEASDGAPTDLYAAMQSLSLGIAAATMFSVETSGFHDELRRMITGYMQGIGRPAPEDFLLPAWFPTPLVILRNRFRRRWRRLVAGVIADRRARASDPEAGDLFDLLAEAHGADADDLLLDEVATMLIAGHETTGLTLFWALYLLAQSPEWAHVVTEEASRVDLSPEGAVHALPLLTKTRAVVQETLRLYSPAFMTARQAARASSVMGLPVPKGSMMLAPFWLLHRNPRLWTEPEIFDPTRFLVGPEPDRSRFLPFGLGPHVCIGAQLAMTEAVLVLARVLRARTVRLVASDRPVLPVATLSTRPDHSPAFRLSAI